MSAVCIFRSYVPMARDILKGSRVKIATVIAFPFGVTFTEIKEAEMRASAARGADEMDFVINIAALKSGDDKSIDEEMQYLTSKARTLGVVTKFIIEAAVPDGRRKDPRLQNRESREAGLHEDLDRLRAVRSNRRRRSAHAIEPAAGNSNQSRRRHSQLRRSG